MRSRGVRSKVLSEAFAAEALEECFYFFTEQSTHTEEIWATIIASLPAAAFVFCSLQGYTARQRFMSFDPNQKSKMVTLHWLAEQEAGLTRAVRIATKGRDDGRGESAHRKAAQPILKMAS
jgi:hypothetical protein